MALKNDRLPIERRLFLTATPRHYTFSGKARDDFVDPYYSMDAEDTYGSVVHRLPFSAAAKAGIICDYKIIISVVTSAMVNDELLRRGVVSVQDAQVRAKQVAILAVECINADGIMHCRWQGQSLEVPMENTDVFDRAFAPEVLRRIIETRSN